MGLLEGKVGLIVGVANERSYAWHIARSLAEAGAKPAFTHLPGEKNERRTRRSLEAIGLGDALLVPMDAARDEDIDSAIAAYADRHDRMDFLVHSIAFAERDYLSPGTFIETPRQAFLQAIDISAYTLVALSRRARPLLSASGSASVMAMSYYGGEKVVPGYNVMGVAKAALEAAARYLAWELGADGTRVNIISGGYLRTLASSAVGGAEAIADQAPMKAPLRRNVEGEDVGKTAVYLASTLASGVSGETIYVDCGLNTVGI